MHSNSSAAAGVSDAMTTLDALEAAVCGFAKVDFNGLSSPERLEALRRLETVTRRLDGAGYELLHAFCEQKSVEEFGGEHAHQVVANALRINRSEVKKRVGTAEQLVPRSSFTGEPLAPELAATAAGVRDGVLGDGHVQVIRSFIRHLPNSVDPGTREHAETQLAECAATMRPDEVRKLADRIAAYLDPDGNFSDDDRARARGVWMGKQGPDAMSRVSGMIDPELRAYLEPIFAKFAAPGMCNPDDEAPVVDGDPDDDTVKRDHRSQGQRQHDALKAMCRALLASGDLGRHRGLPVAAIVSTTLGELADLAGPAATAGGSLLPIRDLVRMAAHAHHYLAVFDDDGGCPLYLGRGKRLATPDQRIVLHARDIGCSFPNCDMPGYLTETHHLSEWAEGGSTDIDNLTFVCHAHHKLAGTGVDQWHTHATRSGRTAWTPPAHVDPRQCPRINRFHHPGETLMGGSASGGDPP